MGVESVLRLGFWRDPDLLSERDRVVAEERTMGVDRESEEAKGKGEGKREKWFNTLTHIR